MKRVLFFVLGILISCNTSNENVDSTISSNLNQDTIKEIDTNKTEVINDERPDVEFKTVNLKGGYSLVYDIQAEETFINLMKGKTVVKTITSGGTGMSISNIGFVEADFENTFILVQASGGGNPRICFLMNKETGNNLIEEFSALIEIDTTSQSLLYSENDIPEKNDKLMLFDIRKNKKENYDFPKEIFGEPEILNRIHLIEITDKIFTIEYEFNDYKSKKQKTYNRLN